MPKLMPFSIVSGVQRVMNEIAASSAVATGAAGGMALSTVIRPFFQSNEPDMPQEPTAFLNSHCLASLTSQLAEIEPLPCADAARLGPSKDAEAARVALMANVQPLTPPLACRSTAAEAWMPNTFHLPVSQCAPN